MDRPRWRGPIGPAKRRRGGGHIKPGGWQAELQRTHPSHALSKEPVVTFATMARLRLRTITNLKATLRGNSLRFGREKPRDLYLATMRGNNPAPPGESHFGFACL